eukprot:15024708-Alexandrium_andersonii.AAC.1
MCIRDRARADTTSVSPPDSPMVPLLGVGDLQGLFAITHHGAFPPVNVGSPGDKLIAGNTLMKNTIAPLHPPDNGRLFPEPMHPWPSNGIEAPNALSPPSLTRPLAAL